MDSQNELLHKLFASYKILQHKLANLETEISTTEKTKKTELGKTIGEHHLRTVKQLESVDNEMMARGVERLEDMKDWEEISPLELCAKVETSHFFAKKMVKDCEQINSIIGQLFKKSKVLKDKKMMLFTQELLWENTMQCLRAKKIIL